MGRNNSSERGQTPVVRPPLEKVWEFEAGDDIISWTVAYGMVFFGSKDKRIYALDTASGEEKWTFEMDTTVHPHTYYFVVADGVLYVLGKDRNLYAIDAQTGEKRWQFSTSEGILYPPQVANEIAYIVTQKKKERILYAIDTQIGQERWRYSTDKTIEHPAVGYGKIFFGSKGKRVYALEALDGDSGERMWEFESGHKNLSRPTFSDGKVLIYGDLDLYAFDANTGVLLWKVNAHEHDPQGPRVVGNLALLGVELTLVDLTSGAEKAKLTPGISHNIDRVKNGIIYTLPATTKGALPTLCAVDLATGELKWYAVIGTSWPYYFGWTWSQEFVFAKASVGKTCAINISRFTKRWEFPEPGSLPEIVDEMVIWWRARKMYGYTSSKDPALQSLLEIGEDITPTPMYTGTVLPIAYTLGGEGKIVWPNCCCLCCGPAEKRVNLVKTMDRVRLWTEGAPYCETCYKKTKGIFKKEKPGVEIIRTSPPTFAFRNEKYWAMFMKANRAR